MLSPAVYATVAGSSTLEQARADALQLSIRASARLISPTSRSKSNTSWLEDPRLWLLLSKSMRTPKNLGSVTLPVAVLPAKMWCLDFRQAVALLTSSLLSHTRGPVERKLPASPATTTRHWRTLPILPSLPKSAPRSFPAQHA